MKQKYGNRLFLILTLLIIGFSTFSTDSKAFKNAMYGPNSETPDKTEVYKFKDRTTGVFKLSHYGTHDWIADAALRLLQSESGTGSADWSWLIYDVLNTDPKWISSYGNGITHNTIRSYMSFLFATQMPDMDPKKENKLRPHKHPQYIDLRKLEGEVIGNYKYGTGVWVGKWYHQTFHWIAEPIGSGQYIFIPKIADGSSSQKAPWYAWKASKAAINCLTHKEQNKNGNYESWAKPEAAASWLGVMAHFIADLACSPHLIQLKEGYYPASPDYHSWFEAQISKFTTWDESLAGPKGFHSRTNFFNIDMSIVGEDGNSIMPIPPYTAAIATATFSIMKSYGRLDEGGLFVKKGDATQENIMNTWDWGEPGKERNSNIPIIAGGLTYKQYYDKVEYLLNTAVYYTAAAMKWTLNEVKKENGGRPETDQWAKLPYYLAHPDKNIPIYDKEKLDNSDESNEVRNAYKDGQFFLFAAMLTSIYAVIVIPAIIVIVFENPF